MATHGITGVEKLMFCILHAGAGFVDYSEGGRGLFTYDVNGGIASVAGAGAGESGGAPDGIPAAVSIEASSTAYATLTAAAGSGVGAAAGTSCAPSPSPESATAAEPPLGADSYSPDPLGQTVEELAEEFRRIAKKVKLRARREDICAIRARVRARAKKHKSFRVWESFVLHYYPAYMAFRTGLRTGNFLLGLAGLRRMAAISCVTSKDRYQWLVVLHLMYTAQMPESDLKIVEQLFSVALRDNRDWMRMGLDERQEIANRFFKKS